MIRRGDKKKVIKDIYYESDWDWLKRQYPNNKTMKKLKRNHCIICIFAVIMALLSAFIIAIGMFENLISNGWSEVVFSNTDGFIVLGEKTPTSRNESE